MELDDLYSFTDLVIKLIRSDDDPESYESVDFYAQLLSQYFKENSK